MASTGEVGCLGEDAATALLTSMLSVGLRIPKKNVLISVGDAKQKVQMLDSVKQLVSKGFTIYATRGTSQFLNEAGVPNITVYQPGEEGHPQALDLLHSKTIELVVSVPKDIVSDPAHDVCYHVRRGAIDLNVPLLTNARLAAAFINAFCTIDIDQLEIKAWDEYK